MAKDITGTLGATNHSTKKRDINDYYGTNPDAVKKLLTYERLAGPVWEPTAGHHNIVDVLTNLNLDVVATDLIDYGYGDRQLDFLAATAEDVEFTDIIMNPPYTLANEFVEHALELVKPNNKVVCFLRLAFLEGQARYKKIFKENPPRYIYVFSKRQVCSRTDDWSEPSAVAYCWAVWEKGYKGEPSLRWL